MITHLSGENEDLKWTITPAGFIAMIKVVRRYLPGTVAVIIVAVLYHLSQPPHLEQSDRESLAGRFRFAQKSLPVLNHGTPQQIRKVHPSLQHAAAWISFVGAAISLTDLDNDGLPNDCIYVDPRFDEIIVCPVPGTGERYEPFLIDHTSLGFDSSSMAPMGSLVGDYNQDGWPDFITYFWGRSPLIFLNQAKSPDEVGTLRLGQFKPKELLGSQAIWHTSAMSQADMDGDGIFDLVVGNYNPDGAGTIDVNSKDREVMMANWARAFNGGLNRILLGTRGSHEFTEVKDVFERDVSCGWTFAIGLADFDSDLLPELYFAQDFGPDRMLHNESTPGNVRFALLKGRRTLSMPRSNVLGQDTFNGMGIDFGDLNRDGYLDMMISNITCDYGLHQSNFAFINSGSAEDFQEGVAPFLDHSESLGLSRGGWAWDVRFGDFDNDGVLEAMQATGFSKGTINRWPELHEMALGNEELIRFPEIFPNLGVDADVAGHQHNPFFVRADDGRYYDVAHEVVTTGNEQGATMGEPYLSRGIATADVDGDGLLDIGLANHWEQSFFYRNTSPTQNRFLGLHLRLSLEDGMGDSLIVESGHPSVQKPSLPAIGAQAKIILSSPPVLIDQVDGGNGHSGQCAPHLLFGLGQIGETETFDVVLQWRDRGGTKRTKTISDLTPGWHTILLGLSPPQSNE